MPASGSSPMRCRSASALPGRQRRAGIDRHHRRVAVLQVGDGRLCPHGHQPPCPGRPARPRRPSRRPSHLFAAQALVARDASRAIEPDHLVAYLDEFAFRFNRRQSFTRGLLFYRLLTAPTRRRLGRMPRSWPTAAARSASSPSHRARARSRRAWRSGSPFDLATWVPASRPSQPGRGRRRNALTLSPFEPTLRV